MKISIFFITVLAQLIVLQAQDTKPLLIPLYRIEARIEPSAGLLQCSILIENPQDSSFILNKDMVISSISADGKPVSYKMNSSNSMPNCTDIILECGIPKELKLEYKGTIIPASFPEMFSRIIMCNSDLVELALYSTWYPRFKNNMLLNYKLKADLPANFITATNGILKTTTTDTGRNITAWDSFEPGFDILLAASPHLQKTEETRNGTIIEIFYNKLPPEYVDSIKNSLAKSMTRLSEIYGAPRVQGFMRMIYSPRNGWGYSRLPAFIVAEEFALSQRLQNGGQANDFRYAVHEVGHFWWMIADMSTTNDWLNEGLAEYSSFRITKELYGAEVVSNFEKEYNDHIKDCQTTISIRETEGSSPDRYVNRYEKTTLMFLEAERRFGTKLLDKFLKSFYIKFIQSHNATTPLFLELAEQIMGKDAEIFFEKVLSCTTDFEKILKD